jgi:hypothetical protein
MATAMPILRQDQNPVLAPGGTSPVATSTAVPVGTSTNTGLQPVTANPYAPPTATSTGTVAVDGGVPTTSSSTGTTVNGLPAGSQQTNGINWNDGSHTATGDFKDTYGAGTGTAITDVLQNLGTSTDSAVQATINNTNLAAGKQYANIQAQEAAAGITPNSSTAGLAAGDFYSTVNSNLQSTVAGMENQEEDTLLNTLVNEGSAHGSDTSGWDTLGSVLSGGESAISALGGAASGASSAVSAASPSSDTSWLDALGALA